MSERARCAGLTERSVFRYFKTKTDIVLAAFCLYWSGGIAHIAQQLPPAGVVGTNAVRRLLPCRGTQFAAIRTCTAEKRGTRRFFEKKRRGFTAKKCYEKIKFYLSIRKAAFLKKKG